MNIFVSHINPIVSAHNLDDKRVVKMVVESAQILQTALHNNGFNELILVRPAWFNHPVVQWAGASRQNYNWLLHHLTSLIELYEEIYGRKHLYHNFPLQFGCTKDFIKDAPPTEFPNCTLYKQHESIDAYQRHLVYKWKFLDKRKTTWKLREKPDFYEKLWNIVDISDGCKKFP
jgi:hypothetical protein